ncbi:LysR family transcriptional regulator [Citromicrobium bathyomarinum]|uniref:LysR family transcriptional regulator n=1 Tax=Sphingomonadales TaxID=204457 RepID=UPI0005A02B5A|nr:MULTISPECIES: LysR family transcriptional regulator [Erythrobacteraceae]KZX53034.1 hypothetical protein A3711_05300 [Erythrobacter sp. HI00D59]MAO15769.1 LysR family transcriptional regulator [Allomuricauda sp.]MAY78125.1 LysR family transcriptional regulator [Citromicrobium sp.]MBN91966.1 LysR family transcriptional regulator [Erythrobacteraceae bacterium]MBW3167499.1 LysR family transcriptional regulator [Qipengyuania flava]
MSRKVRPLEAIEAFLAVAEAGGVRAGAATLSLSPSATSRRIAALEAFLDIDLFNRSNGGLQLTAAGMTYRNAAEAAIEALGRVQTMGTPKRDATLTVAASHSLALRWLIPRSGDFALTTGVRLDVRPTRDPNILRSGEAQLAIWASFQDPDLLSENVLEVLGCPVSAPSLIEEQGGELGEADIARLPLLAPRLPENLWPRWLALAGLDHEEIDVRLFDTNVLAYEAAAAGLGVALAIPFMCEEHLARGSLVPCGQSRLIGEHYRLYRRRSRAGPSAPETHFIHWARREARKAGDRFAAIG